MDTDTLRLILFILACILVLAIYLWGNRRVKQKRSPHVPKDNVSVRDDTESDPSAADATDFAWSNKAEPDPARIDQELDKLGEILAKEREPTHQKQSDAEPVSTSVPDENVQVDLFQNQPHTEQAAHALPTKILQIGIAARRASIAGEAIAEAADATGLVAGENQIYHRVSDKSKGQKVLFSMASMVEPGIFPFQAMHDFTTPGVILFAQLPTSISGLALYSDMLFTAQRIAHRLDGELRDETHSVLTKQSIDHTREQILEYERQTQLAAKKV